MSKDNLEKIIQRIKIANTILVVSHMNPDADAYGSQCGLSLALSKYGKSVYTYNESDFDQYYNFIPGAAEVSNVLPELNFDLIIICDCGDQKRVGDKSQAIINSNIDLINIDHHISNASFGHFNLLDVKASSTCELIALLVSAIDKNLICAKVATCLLAGIYADTGSFRYSSVSAHTLKTAAELFVDGFDHQNLMNAMFSARRLSSLKLEARVFTNLKLFFKDRVALVSVKQRDLDACGANAADTEGFCEKLRDVAGVEVSILIRVDGRFTKTSMRSLAGTVNVSEIAQSFNGGGHINAAGFRSKKSSKQVEEALLKSLEVIYSNK